MEINEEEEDVNVKFNRVVETLERLRQQHLKNLETSLKPAFTVLQDVENFAQKQLNLFETINNAQSNFSSKEIMKSVKNMNASLETPDRDTAIWLVTATKAALQGVHKVKKDDSHKKPLEYGALEEHRRVLEKSKTWVLNNEHFNSCLKNVIDYYLVSNVVILIFLYVYFLFCQLETYFL